MYETSSNIVLVGLRCLFHFKQVSCQPAYTTEREKQFECTDVGGYVIGREQVEGSHLRGSGDDE